MQLKYLGTGSSEGIPSPFCSCRVCENARAKGGKEVRHRTSALIDGDFLIDVSPDTFSRAASLGLNLGRLKHILFTHTHDDHFYVKELLNVMPPFAVRHSKSRISVLGSAYALGELKKEIPENKFRSLSDYIELMELKLFTPQTVSSYVITPLKARHGTPGAFIYIIEKEGRRILYAHDTGFLPEETWDYIAGIYFDFVSLDCTHLTSSGTAGHMCIEDDITIKKRLFQIGCVNNRTRFAATHFSHNGGLSHFEIDERLRLYGFITTYDGLNINI
jgi:phosphoribosyl 1,2-cyclic phosphate phosphodiesterase